jgi:hypothetical protein
MQLCFGVRRREREKKGPRGREWKGGREWGEGILY